MVFLKALLCPGILEKRCLKYTTRVPITSCRYPEVVPIRPFNYKTRYYLLFYTSSWPHLFISCPSEEASFIWLLFFLPRQGQREEASQKISFLCNLERATCSSLIRTGGTSVDFVPLLCCLFLGSISTYFWDLSSGRDTWNAACLLSPFHKSQQSHTNVKMLSSNKKEKSQS